MTLGDTQRAPEPLPSRPRRPRRRSRALAVTLRSASVLGELMVTAGVLIVLFLVWQLLWTDVVADRAQAAIVQQVESTWTAPPDTTIPQVQRHTDDPPPEPAPVEGKVWATIYVPRFGKHYVRPVAEGIDKTTVLDKLGVGHYPTTQMPGELGNFAVAGHRTTFVKPFAQIAEIRKGDAIVFRTKTTWYVYRATDHLVVWPGQVGVLSPVPDDGWQVTQPTGPLTKRYLTMTSCHPKVWGVKRYVQHGVLSYWAPVSSGVPPELAGMDLSKDGKKATS